jgi:hypothetical protein
MKAREFLFHITWMWLTVMTALMCISALLSADGGGYVFIFGLFMSGLQAGWQSAMLYRRFAGLVYGVDQ